MDVDDDFIAAGGDSLLAVELLARLEGIFPDAASRPPVNVGLARRYESSAEQIVARSSTRSAIDAGSGD